MPNDETLEEGHSFLMGKSLSKLLKRGESATMNFTF